MIGENRQLVTNEPVEVGVLETVILDQKQLC